jgi:hypothetical protein
MIVEKWFADHDADGEFVCHVRAVPYSVIGPAPVAGSLVFATKPTLVSVAIHVEGSAAGLSLVGRYGLPREADLNWIIPMIGTRELLFLGDMDPPDLMVFAWLRDRLRPKQVRFLGVNDQFLDVSGISAPESFAIPLAGSERRSLAVLPEVLPDFREIVGPHCAQMLESEYKIEIEAILNAAQSPAASLFSAFGQLICPRDSSDSPAELK